MTFDRWLGIIGAVGTIFGIVGCFLAWYFFRRSEKVRIPTFVAHPDRRVLANGSLTRFKEFSVLYNGRSVGGNGITELLVYFWNSGTLPVLRSHVLETYTVSLPTEILHYEITKLSRNVIQLQLSRSDDKPTKLALSFEVLEPGDGATIRIIYDGDRKSQIEFAGACVGSPKPNVLLPSGVYFTSRSRRILSGLVTFLAPLIMALIVLGVVSVLLYVVNRLFGEHAGGAILVTIVVILGSTVLGAILWGAYKNISAKYIPPDIRP